MDVLRPDGFSLRPGGSLEVRAGGLVYLADPRRALRLDPDGLFTAGALATYDYLGWGIDNYGALATDRVLVNSIVLVEFTLEFFRFVHRELVPRAKPSNWIFRIDCRRLQSGAPMGQGSGPVVLGRGITPGGFPTDSSPASSDDWDKSFDGPTTSGADALRALRLVYMLFGQPASAIPFVIDREVSAYEIQQLDTA
jgi:hypothetical protein